MTEHKQILRIKPRRLQFQGGSVYVSLPMDWVTHHDLQIHRSVEMFVDDESRLIIYPMLLKKIDQEDERK